MSELSEREQNTIDGLKRGSKISDLLAELFALGLGKFVMKKCYPNWSM